MSIGKKLVVILFVSVCCIGCDQSTKFYASEHLSKSKSNSYFSGTVRIGYTENKGAFLGLGKDLPDRLRHIVFTVCVGIFLALFFLYLVFSHAPSMVILIGLSCMFSGGVGNFIDRATNSGAVVDFINIGVGPLRTGIFNMADVAIMLGFVLFLYGSYCIAESE